MLNLLSDNTGTQRRDWGAATGLKRAVLKKKQPPDMSGWVGIATNSFLHCERLTSVENAAKHVKEYLAKYMHVPPSSLCNPFQTWMQIRSIHGNRELEPMLHVYFARPNNNDHQPLRRADDVNTPVVLPQLHSNKSQLASTPSSTTTRTRSLLVSAKAELEMHIHSQRSERVWVVSFHTCLDRFAMHPECLQVEASLSMHKDAGKAIQQFVKCTAKLYLASSFITVLLPYNTIWAVLKNEKRKRKLQTQTVPGSLDVSLQDHELLCHLKHLRKDCPAEYEMLVKDMNEKRADYLSKRLDKLQEHHQKQVKDLKHKCSSDRDLDERLEQLQQKHEMLLEVFNEQRKSWVTAHKFLLCIRIPSEVMNRTMIELVHSHQVELLQRPPRL